MNLNVIKSKIFKWLKELKKVFETILERELSFSYKEVNYEIILKIEEIKSSSLILTKPEE